MGKGYIINKNMQNKEITYIEYEKNKGFDVKPKNKLKKSDSIDVTKVVFMSPTLIEKILNKKIDKQYKKILMMVGEIASSDDDDTGRMIGVLNQVELFKSIIKKKYANFMTEDQTNKLLRRLNLMGKEIKRRIYQIEEERNYYYNEYQGKSR